MALWSLDVIVGGHCMVSLPFIGQVGASNKLFPAKVLLRGRGAPFAPNGKPLRRSPAGGRTPKAFAKAKYPVPGGNYPHPHTSSMDRHTSRANPEQGTSRAPSMSLARS